MKFHILLIALVAACSQENPTPDPEPGKKSAGPEVHYYSLGRN